MFQLSSFTVSSAGRTLPSFITLGSVSQVYLGLGPVLVQVRVLIVCRIFCLQCFWSIMSVILELFGEPISVSVCVLRSS